MAPAARRRQRPRKTSRNAPKPSEKPWTVMVYMAASTDEKTEAAAIRDLAELQKVGTTEQVNVVVQIDRRWPGYFERYCVWRGGSERRDSSPLTGALKAFLAQGNPHALGSFYSENIDTLRKLVGAKNENELNECLCRRDPDILHKVFSTGNPVILRDFVCWVRDEFPAKNYLLVLWGHAFGLGFGRDHGDALAMPELAWALRPAGLKLPEGKRPVDIVGANACAMSYAEAAYQLREAADFMVAPEIAMPFAGWPYEAILNQIREHADIEPKDLSKKIIELFIESFENAFERRSVALTLLNLSKADQLKDLLKAVAEPLTLAIRNNETRNDVANAFLDTAHGEVRPLIDLFDLCSRLREMNGGGSKKIMPPAKDLQEFLRPKEDGFIVEHDAAALEGLHGLGIYAPSVTGRAELDGLELSKKNYIELSLSTQTRWADLVYDHLEAALEPKFEGVAEFVNEAGAVTREDRMGVAQLVMSVQRSFTRLQSTLADSEKLLTGLIKEKEKQGTAGRRTLIDSTRMFGPPYLHLLNGAAPTSPSTSSASSARTRRAPLNGRLVDAVTPLANIEDELANVERTARKVLTHSRLGLGGGAAKSDLGKADLGKADLGKADLGKADLGKADLGKADLGKADLGLLSVFGGSDNGTSIETTVAGLFRQVAVSLQMLEQAVGKLEGVAHGVLTNAATAHNGSEPDDYERRLINQLKGAFQEVVEVANSAKQTLGAVLRHPSHGLGPQSALGPADRQQLAIAGGLSSRNLQLL